MPVIPVEQNFWRTVLDLIAVMNLRHVNEETADASNRVIFIIQTDGVLIDHFVLVSCSYWLNNQASLLVKDFANTLD